MTLADITEQCDKLIEGPDFTTGVRAAKSLKIALETLRVIKSIEDFATIPTVIELSDKALAAIQKAFE